MDAAELDVAIDELETRLERLRSLYEQYFMGIERIEPAIARKDVDRRIYLLRREKIRNTAKRFKLQTIIQRYNTFQQYWQRICREIENGTYKRHLLRAQKNGDLLTIAARKRLGRQARPSSAPPAEAAPSQPPIAAPPSSPPIAAAPLGPPAPIQPLPGLGSLTRRPPLPSRQSELAAPSPAAAAPPLPVPAPPRPAPPRPAARAPEPPKLDSLDLDMDFMGDWDPSANRDARPKPAPVARPAPVPVARPAPAAPVAKPAAPVPVAKPAPPAPVARPAPPATPGAKPAAAPIPVPKPAAAPAPKPAVAPVPKPAAAMPAREPAPAPSAEEARLRELHQRLQQAKQQTNEPKVSFEGMAKSVRAAEAKLREQHRDRKIDFDVVIKDGKAIVKPILR